MRSWWRRRRCAGRTRPAPHLRRARQKARRQSCQLLPTLPYQARSRANCAEPGGAERTFAGAPAEQAQTRRPHWRHRLPRCARCVATPPPVPSAGAASPHAQHRQVAYGVRGDSRHGPNVQQRSGAAGADAPGAPAGSAPPLRRQCCRAPPSFVGRRRLSARSTRRRCVRSSQRKAARTGCSAALRRGSRRGAGRTGWTGRSRNGAGRSRSGCAVSRRRRSPRPPRPGRLRSSRGRAGWCGSSPAPRCCARAGRPARGRWR